MDAAPLEGVRLDILVLDAPDALARDLCRRVCLCNLLLEAAHVEAASEPGATAVVTYKTHDKFNFQGTSNDDIATFSAILEKGLGGWRICHAHRATGQTPT